MDRTEHRGPDERGELLLDEWAGLGHVRLSITDVARGQQPISNEDGSVSAIVNGEFYDFERIRDGLISRGHHFKTASDSEILVHLWEEQGAACLSELRGEFAFVLVDRSSDQMFAARDRFGIKPLFLARPEGELLLASEVKALFAAGFPATWDSTSVFDSLHGCRHEGRPSVFNGVEEVPPGHYLLYNAVTGTDQLTRYWSPDYPRRNMGELLGWKAGPCADEAATKDRVRAVLEESVALRASCELPVACYLSGGVDSAAVLGMARRLTGRSFDAFTVRFDHPDYDESEAAREMAEHAGARYHEVLVSDNEFADSFVESVVQCEGPQINGHACARFLLSKTVRDAGFKVVLGGEGGDEMFAGYGFVRAALPKDQLGEGMEEELPVGVSATAIHDERPKAIHDALWNTSPVFATAAKVLSLPSDLTGVLGEGVLLAEELLHPDFKEVHRQRDPFLEFLRQFDLHKQIGIGTQPFQVLLHIWMRSHFPGYVLAAERLDAYHAVEMRLPFLDHKLFEVCRELRNDLAVISATFSTKVSFSIFGAIMTEFYQILCNLQRAACSTRGTAIRLCCAASPQVT